MNKYFEKTREERTEHTDLTTECKFGTKYLARQALRKFLGVAKPKGGAWHTCHLCENDTGKRTDKFCINPLHLYFGTHSENMMDKSPEVRKIGPRAGSRAGGITRGNQPNNPNKLQVTCPHCGKVGNKLPMSRWHFDKCKHQSFSLASVTMPFFP